MVDMFFYRDPDEVEKQQQEEAQSKALAAAGATDEAAPAQEWDVAAAPQAGGINPAVLESGASLSFFSLSFKTIFNDYFPSGALDWSADPAPTGDWSAEPAGAGWGTEAAPQATTGWE